MAMVMIFVCFIAYTQTKQFEAVVLVGLLLSAGFIALYPPVIWTIGIPLLVAFGVTTVFFFLYKTRRVKHSSAYTEDFGE
jgi:membrane protein CcdC involved in cytochrome C biogenesis